MKKRVLFIGAHPDDIEIWAGGTIFKMKESGQFEIVHIVLTDGAASLTGTREERKREQDFALEILKPDFHEYLGFPDTSLAFKNDLPIILANIVRKYRPHLIFTHNPLDKHPDHSAIGSAIQKALFLASTKSETLEGEPHLCNNLIFFVSDPLQIPKHLYFVDISEYVAKKEELIKVFKTQLAVLLPMLQVNYLYGELLGLRAAEAFEIVKLVDGVF
ncbi:PIG-L deacetylase family protein [Fervidobacterium thailandense]|uniref:GlcNAc-PI de-N-acetylase n=1 Tax=Fervidobacterium thailandense TaxID=1008305 RepID=A0A1E3G3Q4_9BACT|nr:PIG-L family deacetylase [Fervidobacterium thailandense]ODN30443.1 hypothetical protein A4H02_05260 [Fervidobacterium thailandense]